MIAGSAADDAAMMPAKRGHIAPAFVLREPKSRISP
jgi:hypothetical protein